MALKKVKGNLERMFDKNLTDLVRGIRNNKDNEVGSLFWFNLFFVLNIWNWIIFIKNCYLFFKVLSVQLISFYASHLGQVYSTMYWWNKTGIETG